MRLLFTLFVCVVISSDSIGQSFNFQESNVGLRFGMDLGVTSIGFTAETPVADDFVEISFNVNDLYHKATVIYKRYTDLELDDLPNLRYYYGIGPSVVFPVLANDVYYGVEVAGGVDYSFDNPPLIVGAEIKPAYFMNLDSGFYPAQFALFVKYDLAKH